MKAELNSMRGKWKMEVRISVASPDDAAELLKIYAPYVRDTAISFEYDAPSLEQFRRRIENTLEKYPYIKAACDGEILGYAYASAFKARPAYDWCVETSIYVRRDVRRGGIGRRLYESLETALRLQNILNANACITYTEHDCEYLTKNSMLFHEKLGYRLVGRFTECGYKFGRWFDMIWMEKHIGEHAPAPSPVIPFPEIRSVFEASME